MMKIEIEKSLNCSQESNLLNALNVLKKRLFSSFLKHCIITEATKEK